MIGSGNSSSTSSLVSNIDFSPIFTFGTANTSGIDKTNEQTATVSPRQDNSTTASVGLGIGGDGSGGAVMRTQDESTGTPFLSDLSQTDKKNIMYAVIGIAGVTGAYFIVKKLSKRRK